MAAIHVFAAAILVCSINSIWNNPYQNWRFFIQHPNKNFVLHPKKRAKMHREALEHLINGESLDEMLESLRNQIPDEDAEQIISNAKNEYNTRKANGSLQDVEYDLYFGDSEKPGSTREKIGLGLVIFSLGATTFSYWNAAPGSSYTIFFGMFIFGIYIAMTS